VKPLNSLEQGIQYCGFIKKINNTGSDLMIVDANGNIDAMSKGIYDIIGSNSEEINK
jgi:hypothetical protein